MKASQKSFLFSIALLFSTFSGLSNSAQAHLLSEECLRTIKSRMKTGDFNFLKIQNSPGSHYIESINSSLQEFKTHPTPKTKIDYSYSYTREGGENRCISLESSFKLTEDQILSPPNSSSSPISIDFDFSIGYTFNTKDLKVEPFIQLTAEVSDPLRLPISKFEQYFIVDPSCSLIFRTGSTTTFGPYPTDPTEPVPVQTVQFDENQGIAGKSLQTTQIEFIKNNRMSEKDDVLRLFKSKPKSLTVFVGFEAKLDLEFDSLQVTRTIDGSPDPIQLDHVTFITHFPESFSTPPMKIDFFYNLEKEYAQSSRMDLASKKVIYRETRSEHSWDLMNGLAPNDSLYLEIQNFTPADFEGDEIHYSIQTQKPLTMRDDLVYLTVNLQKSEAGTFTYRVKTTKGESHAKVHMDPDHAKKYLAPTAFYDFNHPEVARYVSEIKNSLHSHASYHSKLLAISKTVLNILPKIDFDSLNTADINPMSASSIIQKGKGVCQHYSALFIAFSRAMGIPARMVLGYHLTAANALGHAWVEVYRDGTWTELEPQMPYLTFPSLHYLPTLSSDIYETPENEKITFEKWQNLENDGLVRANFFKDL